MQSITSAVNQKKAYAELLLQAADDGATNRHLQQALFQSAAMQLETAYRFFLVEIGAAYQCKNLVEITDLSALIASLQSQGKNPAETTEIGLLAQQSDSWLRQLQSCCTAISARPAIEAPVREVVADPNRIAIHTTSEGEDWSVLADIQLRQWLDGFSELVERHRQCMVEW